MSTDAHFPTAEERESILIKVSEAMQYAMGADMCEPVERITGRTVRSFHSSLDTHAGGLAAETFLFHPEELSDEENAAAERISTLIATGDLRPLVDALRTGEQSPEDAGELLTTLVDLDRDRFVQLTLATLISEG